MERGDESTVSDRVYGTILLLMMATTLAGQDAKPAFIGNIYGPLASAPVPADAPPLFIALAADDPLFGNPGYDMIDSWRTAKRAVEFHL